MKVNIGYNSYEIIDYYRKDDFIFFKDNNEVDKLQISLKDIKIIKDLKEHCIWDFKEITDSPSGLDYKWDVMEGRKTRGWTRRIKEIDIIRLKNNTIIVDIKGVK